VVNTSICIFERPYYELSSESKEPASDLAYDLGQYLCDLGRAVRAGQVSCLDNATLFALLVD